MICKGPLICGTDGGEDLIELSYSVVCDDKWGFYNLGRCEKSEVNTCGRASFLYLLTR